MAKKKIVVLISGSGSNLQAFIEAQYNDSLGGELVAVFSNIADAFGLKRAEKAGIPAIAISHKDFSSREEFDRNLATQINAYQPDLVILAGFMRILSPAFVNTFYGRLLNIHPSLLPKYPGLNTHKRAIDNSDEFHGSSVHFVTEELDGGPVIAQARLSLRNLLDNSESDNSNESGDCNKTDEQRVIKQIQRLEHQLYPKVAHWFLNDQLTMQADGVYFEQKKLQQPILIQTR